MTATIEMTVTIASTIIEVAAEDSNNASMTAVSVTLTITPKEALTTMAKEEDSTITADTITIEASTTTVDSTTTEDSIIIAAEDLTTTVEAEVSKIVKIANSTMTDAHRTTLGMRATFWMIIQLNWEEITKIEEKTTSIEETATNLETTTVPHAVWTTSSTIITTAIA